MPRLISLCSAAALLAFTAGVANAQAGHQPVTLAVTMTNDPASNEIKVYDVGTHALLQTLPTFGKGGVGGNARGVRQFDGEVFVFLVQRVPGVGCVEEKIEEESIGVSQGYSPWWKGRPRW